MPITIHVRNGRRIVDLFLHEGDEMIKALVQFKTGGLADLRRWPQFANEPANISRLHWIRRYSDLFDVIAFGAVERAKFKSCRPPRDALKLHALSAFRAAKLLNCE
jgi:hypothetical protein